MATIYDASEVCLVTGETTIYVGDWLPYTVSLEKGLMASVGNENYVLFDVCQ